MARKKRRMKTEYRRGLGFDPRKYISDSSHAQHKHEKKIAVGHRSVGISGLQILAVTHTAVYNRGADLS